MFGINPTTTSPLELLPQPPPPRPSPPVLSTSCAASPFNDTTALLTDSPLAPFHQ
ncbi:hypothetical protein BDV93DRAFT_526022 [Ceratobasidium sp. AG-I]|nr:hypothetical protein BDV93DRAFT_526022 [Ceratobasidium sp. AG-I]